MQNVREIIAETFRINANDISATTTINDIDTWDSLTHMELVANLESRLGIEFTGDEIAEMFDVSAIEKIISGKI